MQVRNRLGGEFRFVVDLVEGLRTALVTAPAVVAVPTLPLAALAAQQTVEPACAVGDRHPERESRRGAERYQKDLPARSTG